jgi:hypothetical protein
MLTGLSTASGFYAASGNAVVEGPDSMPPLLSVLTGVNADSLVWRAHKNGPADRACVVACSSWLMIQSAGQASMRRAGAALIQ